MSEEASPTQGPRSKALDGYLFSTKMPPRRYFASVQGLRGVSAMSVFVVHIYLMALHGGFFPAGFDDLQAALSTLGNGVALFFIISGFVIPASLFRHHDVRRFILDRFLRIMPLFLIIHLIVFIIGPAVGYKWLQGIGTLHFLALFFTNMTFTALPLGLPLAQQNSWTLTYEWGFYLFVSLAWVLFGAPRYARLKFASVALTALGICVIFPICLYFILGVCFSKFHVKLRFSRVAECILIPISIVGFFYSCEFLSYGLAVLPAALIFRAVLQDDSMTSRCLCTPFLQYCGKISFSLYLIHPLAMFPFQATGAYLVHRHVSGPIIFSLFVPIAISATFILSTISYFCVEVRLRAQLSVWLRLESRSRKQTVSACSA